MDLKGILVYATTNKAASLPSELLSRARFLLTFDALGASDARDILDVHVRAECADSAERELVLDAVIDFIHDAAEDEAVATVVLRDRSEVLVQRRHLKQVSGRLYKDLAARFAEHCAARGNGTPALLRVEDALRIARLKFAELVTGIELTPENVGERTFLHFAPHNPPVEVRLRPHTAARSSWFRYAPLEIDHA
jgi:hypothetical protein